MLVVTGALELFYYIPSSDGANKSVQVITYLVPYGWLVRGLHYWAAQALVVSVSLHMLRVVFTGGYKRPRRFNWLLGVSLLVLVVLLNFTGFVLRWDTDIEWALLVGTNLLKSIPLIGSELYGMLVGGQEIGPDTVVRFYSWHIFALAVMGFGVMIWHIFRVRRDGGIASQPCNSRKQQAGASLQAGQAARGSAWLAGDGAPASRGRISRNDLVRREALAMLIVMTGLLALALWFPPAIGPVGDFGQMTDEAVAPWFFLWVQQLLRWGDPFPMGVLIPIGMLALLVLVPYLFDRSTTGVASWFNREGRRAQLMVIGLIVLVLGLTIVAMLQ